MKVLTTFTVKVSLYLNGMDERTAEAALNMHHFNDVECNKWEDGKYVAKYPEKETPGIKESYYNVRRSYQQEVLIDLMSDGTLRNPRFKNNE